jgi:hypothetical protein
VTAPGAPVSAEADLQNRGPPPERLVRQPPDHRVPGRALAFAATTPFVGLDNPAPESRPIGLQPLREHFEPEIIKTSERGQVRAGEGSVRHVEVFQMDGIVTSILGRPRPLPGYRRADRTTPLNCDCEEPKNSPGARVGLRAMFRP